MSDSNTATILDFARLKRWDGLKLELNGVIWDKSVVLSLPGLKQVVVAVEKVTINVTWQRRDLEDGDDGKENDEAKRVPNLRANGDMTRARQGGKKNEVATAHREAGALAEAGAGAGEGTGPEEEWAPAATAKAATANTKKKAVEKRKKSDSDEDALVAKKAPRKEDRRRQLEEQQQRRKAERSAGPEEE